jgi:hypothetical protein
MIEKDEVVPEGTVETPAEATPPETPVTPTTETPATPPPALDPEPPAPPPPPPPDDLKWRVWPKGPTDKALKTGDKVRAVVDKGYKYALVSGGFGTRPDRPNQPLVVARVSDTLEGTEVLGPGAAWNYAMKVEILAE